MNSKKPCGPTEKGCSLIVFLLFMSSNEKQNGTSNGIKHLISPWYDNLAVDNRHTFAVDHLSFVQGQHLMTKESETYE